MRLYLALVGLVGCGFQPRAATAPDGSVDAAGDVAIDGLDDGDGDGVPDVIDNCPTLANADQRDHDVDGRGDVCDLCPHIAEASDTDSDGDGVGDACDPRPSTPGDHRALWNGFYDANDIATWLVNGTDGVSMGRLVIGNANMGLQYTFPNVQFANAYAVTSVRAMAVGAQINSPLIEMQNGNNSVDQAYLCYIARSTMASTANAYEFWPGQAPQTTSALWTGAFATNSDFVIADEVTGTSHTCTIAQGATVAQPTQTAGPHAGQVLLGSQYATAAFDYLFVVEIGQ